MAESDPLRLEVDAVLVPRAVLDTIALALAAIIRVSGEGLGEIIDRLDRHDGDHALSPDALSYGSDGPGCGVSDAGEWSYLEWHTQRANTRTHCLAAGHEDDEDDEEDDPKEE